MRRELMGNKRSIRRTDEFSEGFAEFVDMHELSVFAAVRFFFCVFAVLFRGRGRGRGRIGVDKTFTLAAIENVKVVAVFA
jgi:hypothetical protein